MATNNFNDELDPISFWILLLLSGGQQFTFHDLVRIMNRTNESVWEALQILQSRHFAKNAHAKFTIDYAGVEYLTRRGILAGEAEDEPKPKDFKRGFKPPFFFSSWTDMFIWLGAPFALTLAAVVYSGKVTDGYNFVSTDKIITQVLVWVVYALLIGLYIWRSYHHILENERIVVFFGGKAIAKKGPGHILLLPIFHNPKKVDLRERSQVITKEPCLTRDNMLVNTGFYIAWEITDPIPSLTKVSKVDDSMSLLSAAVLRATVAEFTLDEALERRRALNTLIQTRIQHKAEDWGVQVNTTEIRELEPPNGVLRQIENRFNATLERDAELERSNAKVRSLRDFLTIGEGMARNPIAFNLKYLDTLEKIGEGASTKYIIPMELFNMLQEALRPQGNGSTPENGNTPRNENNPPEQLPPGGSVQ